MATGVSCCRLLDRKIRMNQARQLALAVSLACALSSAALAIDETLLLQDPTISRDQIVFRYAEDLWVVARSGGGDANNVIGLVVIASLPDIAEHLFELRQIVFWFRV